MAVPLFKSAVARQVIRCAGEVYVVAASVIAIAEIAKPVPSATRGFVAAVLAPVTLAFTGIALHSAVRARQRWSQRRRGADVGRALASLRHGYRVLSRLPLTQRHEDRVVVGSNGIFVVVTDEGRSGRSNSLWRGMIDDCHIEALRVRARVRRTLRRPLPVHAVLCVRHDGDREVRQTQGVRIVDTAHLASLIMNTFTTAPLGSGDIEAAVTALTAGTLESIPVGRRQRTRPRRQEQRSERRLMLV